MVLWPSESEPQHAAVPSVLIPHAWAPPADSWRNVLPGGAAIAPQQASVASVLIPQLKPSPALASMKVPAGGVACPLSFLPQQATARLVCTPHVWRSPASTLPTTCRIATREAARSDPALA